MKTYSIPIKIIIEVGDPTEHIEYVQPTLLPKEELTVNGKGEPLPWEKPKRGRGRPKKVIEPTDKPKTESMLYTLKHKLHLMDDQIAAMSFNDATQAIGKYYQTHPKS